MVETQKSALKINSNRAKTKSSIILSIIKKTTYCSYFE